MDASVFGYGTIALMALVVYATRIAGSELMSHVAMTPRIEAVLKTMASSVLVAIVVSECARGGMRTSLAVLAAICVMLVVRNAYAAMSAGVAIAAACTFLVS
ncbi:MAG: AzlD domain-containing protein [Alphaproteobacteria bacterium]|nr:AzlD domain-containing protein [Alphaproteobacteria bacterium]